MMDWIIPLRWNSMLRDQTVLRPFAACLVGLVLLVAGTSEVAAQTEEPDGVAILQQDPYDLVIIKEDKGGGQVMVEPLEIPGRKLPPEEDRGGALRLRPLSKPGRDYEVAWPAVKDIIFWEDRILNEAKRRLEEKDFDGAFPFIALLLRDFPKTPGLREMRREYLFQNALHTYTVLKDPGRTLAIFDELRRYDRSYKAEMVSSAISKLTDQTLQQLLDKGDLANAQRQLQRLQEKYPPEEISTIPAWKKKFREMAEAKRDQALAAMKANNFRVARDFAIDMINIDPSIPNGKELIQEINVTYPMVRVGVLQRAVELDPTRIDNWAARRGGRLVYRALYEMQGTGVEGGEYSMPLGISEVSDDQLTMTLRIRSDQLPPPFHLADAFTIADFMMARADPSNALYNPAWAGVLKEIEVPRVGEVIAHLRRPHVLPQAMLQVRLDNKTLQFGDENSISGSYSLQESDDGGVVYRFAGPGKPAATQPREVYEVTMKDGATAISSLLRGDVDMLDQLFPVDAERLRRSGRVKVEDFPLPTLHLMIPWSDHPYVTDRTTRRALLYGINREEILRSDLTGGADIPGCQVLSGPVPAGAGPEDPLGYAYDHTIKPLSYQPKLGALLLELRRRQWAEMAEKKKEEPPTYGPLKIGYPANEIARVASQAIAQQLSMLQIKVELLELPDGVTQPERGTCDLLYSVVAMWEPVTDARRVLGPDGLAHSNDQMVGLGLRQVESGRNWKDVRDGLLEMHRICHHELPVMPLYQLVDSFAYRPDIQGVGSGIVSLYQNITKWRLNR